LPPSRPSAAASSAYFLVRFFFTRRRFHSFPTRRSSDLFLRRRRTFVFTLAPDLARARFKDAALRWQRIVLVLALLVVAVRKLTEDRKSTRLNSSHVAISYAVFCLKQQIRRTCRPAGARW